MIHLFVLFVLWYADTWLLVIFTVLFKPCTINIFSLTKQQLPAFNLARNLRKHNEDFYHYLVPFGYFVLLWPIFVSCSLLWWMPQQSCSRFLCLLRQFGSARYITTEWYSLLNEWFVGNQHFYQYFKYYFLISIRCTCCLYGVCSFSITHKIESRTYSLYFIIHFAHLIIV